MSRLGSAALVLLFLLAGCAAHGERPALPEAAEVRPGALVLDGSLAHPSVHRALLSRLAAAGLSPVYRRYDPRLGDADLERYDIVVWLAGRVRGSRGSLAVRAAEVDRAVRLVERGGRLVLGVPPGRGRLGAEERAFQEILDRLGVPITIEPHEVVDLAPESSYVAPLFRAPLFAPDPNHPATRNLPSRIVGDRSSPLLVGPGAAPLLWTLPTSFLDRIYGPPPDDPAAFKRRVVAAEGEAGTRGGRVLVISRFLLDAGGAHLAAPGEPLLPGRLPPEALAGREQFLAAVFRTLVRGEAGGEGPRTIQAAAVTAAATAGGGASASCGTLRPGEAWLEREGFRAGWGYVNRPPAEVDALLARLPASGLNVLWGPARWDGLAWPERDPETAAAARARLARIEAALRGTGVRWLAGIGVPGNRADFGPYRRAVSISGLRFEAPSLVDSRFWEERIFPQIEALARSAGEVTSLAGVILDLEMYHAEVPYYGDGFDFGDGPFLAFLDEAARADGGAAGRFEAARRLPAAARGDWLLANGELAAYYAWLERRAEAIGRRLREALDAASPAGRDLVLGFYAIGILPSWFYRGLWRGASAAERPILLLTFQADAAVDLRAAAADGICIRHALAALLGLVGESGLAPVLTRAAREHDGFWLNRITTLVAPPGQFLAVETPAGLRGDEAWRWLAEGVRAYMESRGGLRWSQEGG